ncbi:MAG: 3-oxoadipate enol-lactonase [Haloarculaceae archaeon]|jgi:3-oxoadipate enol-lactonase
MADADNDGVRLAYDRIGTPEGETVVFVEGLGYGRWMWRWQRQELADSLDMLLWDNRGTGESDTPEGPYAMSEMAADLEAVLADAGVERAHVVGASMGGMIAQQYALEYDRATSLVLLSTTPGGPAEEPIPPETLDRMFDVPPEYDERESIRYKMEPAMTEQFWEENQDLIDDIVDWRLEMDASDRARQWQAAAVEAFDVSEQLDAVTVPALVIHGEDDRVVPVENGRLLAEKLPDSTFETVEDGGSHLCFVERASTVSDRIRDFVTTQQSTGE